MSIQVTILGLSKIGASFGLALGRHPDQVERTGYDPQIQICQAARKINAVDRIGMDLLDVVRNADVVLLALPLHLLKDFLIAIGPNIRPEAVFLDTSATKASVASWVQEFLPVKCHYVGLWSRLNPLYLDDLRESIEAAAVDLFENCPMCIAAPSGTPAAALDLAANLSLLLGARPLFCDLAEMDGLISSTQLLPQLVSTAFLNGTLDQPGWTDAGKFAGVFYAAASSSISARGESSSLQQAFLLNKVHLLRCLDGFQSALQALRSDIENNQADQLELRLEHARSGRMKWLDSFHQPDQGMMNSVMPKPGDFWRQQVGFFARSPRKRPTKPDQKQKKD